MPQLNQALTRLFDKHRIVFWYDDKQELWTEFDAADLPGVEKIVLDNNAFAVKYRILRAQPSHKFLLYHAGPPPADLDNWLLDVQLAHGLFRADQTALWLDELGLGFEFAEVVEPHVEFFRATRRRETLAQMLKPDDTPRQVLLKMLAVSAGAEPRLDDILENLLADLAVTKDERIRLIERCALDKVLWTQLDRAFGYTSDTPGLRDFVIALFNAVYRQRLGGPSRLNNDAVVFFKRWKDSVRHQAAFETLSAQCAPVLGIEQDLAQRQTRDLVDLDLFELIDRKILSDLVRDVANRTLAAGACTQWVRQRRQSHWYARYEHPYEAVEIAARLLTFLDTVDLTVRSLSDGIQQYAAVWCQADQLYRQFIYHTRQSGQPTLLAALAEQVENQYTTNFLLKLNDRWQPWVDACTRWEAAPIMAQQEFYAKCVRPFLTKGNKVFVVISDALRYEIGEELLRRICQEDRYDATLTPALATLPSYTQLGMAALLPHTQLTLANDGAGTVLVDGLSSQGTENRQNILEQTLPGRALAIKAGDLLALGRDESRALIRDYEVVYVYHNRIDAIGDKRETEERVFDEVELALDELILIIKKLANANANNLFVTADHGFIHQQRALEETDFLAGEPGGSQITWRNRRFVLGQGLHASPSFKHFTAQAVGLQGETELLLPKSINRLRVRGAGSRYVHGGAALQEVVIPVIQINKKRQSDVTTVDVDILRSGNAKISTGQLAVAFYQTQPVTEKVQPRTLRAGLYTAAGVLISDQHTVTFDMPSENARERELRVQFVLTRQADAANNQDVILRLDERVPDTSHYQEYKTVRYQLRRSFTSDFDF